MARTQTAEAQSFIQRVLDSPKGPGVLLDPILKPSLEDETELRRLFATDKAHARLSNPYVGLVDVFNAPADIRITRERVVKDETDLSAHYVMPLSELNRRKEGTPSMVPDIDEFKKNWGVFSEGSLSQLSDWNNVVAAGGAVLACLTPLSEDAKVSKRSMRKYYHSAAYPTSDVDLFLWGLTSEQAEVKITKIYEAVRDSVPWDVTCVRTKHTVSIHSQYPYRSVQIVLRLYSSPAEILAGFDIDAPCCAYDGNRVYANPRAIIAQMRQCNTVDMTRRSPSYEVRLSKYSARAFEVYVPSLSRADIDPTIYERSIVRVTGLARLLVLEKLTSTDVRFAFLESRRTLRGRPNPLNQYNRRSKRKFKGDLKAEAMAIGGLEMNDYDVASLHIPYGPGWDARRIDKLVYQTDLGMNSTFNPKNKGRRLHRHPAFFGTIEECMEDCCEHCPAPIDDDERKLQADKDEGYIRGRISFIQDDPGRQTLSGSFNPVDVGEWSAQVYIGPTERFFTAIAIHDRAGVARMLAEGQDVNSRDHVGRAPLHVAIICRAADIACDLVDAGARMTARLVDGRTSLHLAVQVDLLPVVKKLLERSVVNAEQAPKDVDADEKGVVVEAERERERASSEDDWSSEDDVDASDEGDGDSEGDEGKPKTNANANEAPTNVGDLPEDEADLPDVFDINLADWDFAFTALSYAIVFGSVPVVEALLNAGADVKLASQVKGSSHAVLPLTLTVLSEDDERLCGIAERLISAGASCSSAAGDTLLTIFHQAVVSNRPNLVSTFLRCDLNGKTALHYPVIDWSGAVLPLVAAVETRNYSVLAAMVAHGVKMVVSQEDIERVYAASSQFSHAPHKEAFNPVETALAQHDDVARLLIDLGANYNLGVKRAVSQNSRPDDRRTLVDWVQYALTTLGERIATLDAQINPPEPVAPEPVSGWKGYVQKCNYDVAVRRAKSRKEMKKKEELGYQETTRNKLIGIREYFADMQKLLLEREAKSWSSIYPDSASTASDSKIDLSGTLFGRILGSKTTANSTEYVLMKESWDQEAVAAYLNPLYDELFEACFTGANQKIEELCLPAETPKKDATLLQVAVSVAHEGGNRYSRTGLTPLFAAIAGRHWDTARLIVAIAAAQYKPKAKTERFSTSAINLDDDSDNESDGSDGSDDTIEQDGINFVDIASRPSTVECEVHPRGLLLPGNVGNREPFSKAINDDDLEAFVNVFNLYKHSPKHVDLSPQLLDSLLFHDRAEMLDEYIRRTGAGITIQKVHHESEEDVPAINDKNKVYLGLTVHGKKRTDLAKLNDPNAAQHEDKVEVPLVWSAVSKGAINILNYLLSDRPLAAYKFYASNNISDTARLLKRTTDLAKVLPEWLGWRMTQLGESPLTAALVSNKRLEMVKYLFEKSPRLMASALHERLKFLGLNPLMIAVQVGCDADLVDFLLAKGVSPAQNDQTRGFNIFHYMCKKNCHELLEHLLNKLPRDVVEVLLAQQSKGRLNTPLHLCAKQGFKKAVKLIVEFSKATALVRDVDGSIPLHCAVRLGFPETIQILIDAAPSGLYMENGVGEAPLEIAVLQDLIVRNQQLANQRGRGFNGVELQNPGADQPPRLDIDQLEAELPKFRTTLEALVGSGVLERTAKPAVDMFAFAEQMEWKLVAAKEARNVDSVVDSRAESGDSAKALANVKAAMNVVDGHRELVHLVDVQTSVQSSLLHAAPVQISSRSKAKQEEEGLAPEEDSEQTELRSSFVYGHLETGPDTA